MGVIMKTKMFRFKISYLVIFCSVIIFIAPNRVQAASKCYTRGVEQYCVITSGNTSKYVNINSTRVKHKSGMTSKVEFSSSQSSSMSSSASITGTVGIPANTIAVSLGVTSTLTYTWKASVGFSLGPNYAPGVYYIRIVYPGTKLSYRYSNSSTQIITTQKVISYVPLINKAYYELAKDK